MAIERNHPTMKLLKVITVFLLFALAGCAEQEDQPSYRMSGARQIQPALAECLGGEQIEALRALNITQIEVVRESERIEWTPIEKLFYPESELPRWHANLAWEVQFRGEAALQLHGDTAPFGWKIEIREGTTVVTTPDVVPRRYRVAEACAELSTKLVDPVLSELRRRKEWVGQ